MFFANFQWFDSVYVDGYIGEAYQTNDTTRSVNFEQIQYQSNAEYDIDSTQWGAAIGHTSSIQSLMVDVALQYKSTNADVEAYQESGGESDVNLNMIYRGQSIDSETVSLSVNAAINISFSAGVLVPYCQIEMMNEREDESRRISANLVLAPNEEPFVVSTDAPDANYGRVSTGLQFVMPQGVAVY